MKRIIKSTALPTVFWENQFTRHELRQICHKHKIKAGRDKSDAANNIKNGVGHFGHTFFIVEVKVNEL